MSRCVDLDERVTAQFYDQECEEWTMQTVTIEDVLDSVCDEYTVLPSAQPENLQLTCNQLATDCISRQTAVDALSNMMDVDGFRDGWAVSRANVDSMLKSLPPAQPERKKGEWIEREVTHIDDLEAKDIISSWQSCKCSVCGRYDTKPYMYYFSEPKYCSWCGADMRKVDE